MKENDIIARRNRVVEEHLHCIDRTIGENAGRLRAARLDPDDVYQQLAMRLIRCASEQDLTETGSDERIEAQLRAELTDCMSARSRYGITHMPSGMSGAVISLEDYRARLASRVEALAA